MATLHGKAGQFGKGEARKRTWGVVSMLIAVGVFGSMILGWVSGYAWGRGGGWAVLTWAIVVAAGAWAALPWFGRYLDRVEKRRIKYLRGGQAEALVAWLLETADDGWHVFNGIKLEAESDIDHVLIGPGGVYCISTKSHRGLFTATADGLLHNGRPCDFAKDALRQAATLAERLRVLMGQDVPWVQAVLAVPLGFVDGERRGACGGKVWVVHQEDLPYRLTGETVPAKLDKEQVRRVVATLDALARTAEKLYRRPTPAGA